MFVKPIVLPETVMLLPKALQPPLPPALFFSPLNFIKALFVTASALPAILIFFSSHLVSYRDDSCTLFSFFITKAEKKIKAPALTKLMSFIINDLAQIPDEIK